MKVDKEAILAKCCKNYKKTVEQDEKPLYNLQLNGHEALLAMDEYLKQGAASLLKKNEELKETWRTGLAKASALLAKKHEVLDRVEEQLQKQTLLTAALQSSNEAKDREIAELKNGLAQAIEVIKSWHNADEVWDIYFNNAPEMKLIKQLSNG